MESERSLRWRGQLQNQHGVVSRQQARDAGFRDDAIDRRLRSGTWQRLYRGVYATFSGALSREAKLWVAVLSAGPDAVLSHQTAAEIHGLSDKPIGKIHVSVPARRTHGSGHRYLDNLYEQYGLCVELDGNAAHPAEGRWRDTHRDNANLVLDARTLRYGWPDVTGHRCRTAAEIAAVLRRQGWTGTLRRCGPSCTATQEPQKRQG